jgi:hypothetical protein
MSSIIANALELSRQELNLQIASINNYGIN